MENLDVNSVDSDTYITAEGSVTSNQHSQEILLTETDSNFFELLDGNCFLGIFKFIGTCLVSIAQRFFEEIHGVELLFITMSSAYSFMCQMFFLTMCDLALLSYNNHDAHAQDPFRAPSTPENRQNVKMINGLSTLLLYSVFSYFVSKVRDISVNSQFIRPTTRTTRPMRDLLKWFLRIILEWVKVIVIVICLREQGLRYEPELLYTVVTVFYYICTDKIFVELLTAFLGVFNVECLDSLEYLYMPILLNSFSIISACLVIGNLVKTEHCVYALVASYFTIYLRLKDLIWHQILPLLLELKTYASFRVATEADLDNWNDICAVCLNQMSRARITPCNHLFHPYCLKRCLQSSFQCPLCKQNFIQDSSYGGVT